MTKIQLELMERGQRWECTACNSFERGYRAEYSCGAKNLISVCEKCIKAEDIDDRLQRRADEFDRHANWVRGLIGKLKVPTFADLQRHKAEEAILQKQLEAQREAEEQQDAYEFDQIEFSLKVAEEKEEEPFPVPVEPEKVGALGSFMDVLNTPAAEISAPEVGA